MGLAIIYIYDSTVTDFTYNGQPLNKAYEVVVDNMINDSFFVTFNHPLDDKGIYKIIEKDKIVKVHTPDGMQPFRIMDRVKYMDHVSIEAWPLFYADMRNKLIRPLTIRGLSGQAAMNMFLNNLLIDTPFTFTSNITDIHDYRTQDAEERENNPNQLYNALGVFKDIVKRWQGELVINGYDVRVVNRLGKNTGALLYEKKNISDFTDEESIQDITTRLYGKSEWTERPEGSDEEVKHEISVKVESPLINAYSGIVFEKQYTNNDIRTEKEMADWLNLKFTTENIDKPSRNIKVGTNIVDDTVISLGDSLVLKYVKHDVDMEIRMVGYTYDGYANRYITVQLGDAKQSYVGNVQNTVREIETNVNNNVKQTVNQILNANGERMIYSVTEPVGNFKNGDVWFDQQGGMYLWDEASGMWIDHPYNRNMRVMEDEVNTAIETAESAKALAVSEAEQALADANKYADDQDALITQQVNTSVGTAISTAEEAKQTAETSYTNAVAEAERLTNAQSTEFNKKFEENATAVSAVSQAAKDADAKAKSALEKAGANANLLTTHQNTLDTIRNTTIPNLNGSISEAKSTAESALSSASSAMSEANKADDKIADYVAKNGLVSGTTVDTKINNATGEISRKVTELAANKLDGTTYTNFYNNEYKQTAQGVTDAWTAVNKIIDKNGNSTDAFAQAVYDKNATRQSAAFKEVTKDLVTTATYTAGVKGINQSIIEIEGKIPTEIGGRNLTPNTEFPSGYIGTYLNFGVMSSTYSGTTYRDTFMAQTTIIPKGEDYVVSFYAKASANVETFCYFYNPGSTTHAVSSTGQTTATTDGKVGVSITTEWQRYWVRWKQNPANTTTKKNLIVGRNMSVPNGTVVSVAGVKLEQGTIPSDWTPAPEDMLGAEEFTIFKNDYEETAESVERRLTAIDSGKEGSIVYNTNLALATSTGNTKSITSLNAKVDGLKIGGQNFLKNSDFSDGLTSWARNNGSYVSFNSDNKTIKVTKGRGGAGLYQFVSEELVVGEMYTFSAEVKGTGSIRLGFDNSAGIAPLTSNDWHRVSYTAIYKGNRAAIFYTSNTSDEFEMRRLKLEKGNVATDWTPSLSEQMGKLEFTLFKNDYEETAKGILSRLTAIDSTEEGSFVTRLNKTESTANGNTTTISNIKAKPGEQITGYQTILERSNLYERVIGADEGGVNANISKIVQTSGIIQSEVSNMEFGGRNLIRNSGAPTNLDEWTPKSSYYGDFSLGVHSFWKSKSENLFILSPNSDVEMTTMSNRFYVKPNTDYTFSMIVFGDSNVSSFDVFFLYRLKGETGSYNDYVASTLNTPSGNEAAKFVWKFKSPNLGSLESAFLRIDHNGRKNTSIASSLYFTNVKLEEGSVATDWTPAIEDTNSKIAQLANSWSMQLTKADDVVTQINATSAGVLIQGKNLILDGNVTMTSSFSVPNANIKDLAVNKITGTTAEFKTMVTKGLTADVITSTMIKADAALFNMLFSTTSATDRLSARDAWIKSANISTLDASKITSGTIDAARLNAGAIVTAGLTANVVKSGHIEAGTALVDKIFSTSAYITQLTSKTAFVSSIQAININASKITSGTLDASKVTVSNLDANNITANKTSFVQSAWNDINSEVAIDGSGIKTQNTNGDFSRIVSGELRSFNKDSSSTAILGSGRSQYFDRAGSQFILGNTLHGTEWINDGTLQVTHNRRFAIGRYADYAVNNGLFHPYIALEYPPDKTGDEPMGIVRFYKAVYLQKDIYAGYNNISGLGKISFYNGGHIESQSNTSNLLIGSSNKLVVYASGSNAFEIDSGYMYLRRNLSMEGNNITNQSDRRLKTKIVDTPVDSLSAISNWSFKAFDRVNNGSHDDIGLIAQDTSEIVIYDEENDIYNVNSSKQIMMNSHGIQQLNIKVDDEITQLKAQIASLQDELAQIKGA